MGKRNKYFMQSSSTPSFKTGSGGGKRRTIFGKIDLTGQMITKKNLPVFWSYTLNGMCSALFVLKSAVWIIRVLKKTILLPYFIMLLFSFMFPLKRL